MAKVAIFDSGVGGLTIYSAIKEVCPDCSYVFVSDNQAHPYGTKSEQELVPRVIACAGKIIKQFSPDILVVACNTASTVVLPRLREEFDLPIVGVVPAIKPAAEKSKTDTFAILATPATIKRPYTQELIDNFAKDMKVIRVGSSAMVALAEAKLAGVKPEQWKIDAELMPILKSSLCDVLVLACTHFPLLNKEIESFFKANNHSISLLDSGQGVAKQVARLLSDTTTAKHSDQSLLAAFTRLDSVDPMLESNLLNYGFTDLTELVV